MLLSPPVSIAPSGRARGTARTAVAGLLAYGADPALSTNHSDGSPLDQARARQRTDIVQLLEDASRKKR